MAFQTKQLSRSEVRIKSLKPWTLPSSVLPLLLGTLLAWKSGRHFDVEIFILCASVVTGTHAAGNFVNSYYEAKTRRFYASRSERHLTIFEAARCAVITYCIVIPAFAYLVLVSKAGLWQEISLFLVGVLGSMFFGNGLKNIAPGELIVCGIYGPVCVLFSYTAQVGPQRELTTLWITTYALPLAFTTECFLHSQNIRDLKVDEEQGARTLAVLLGNRYAVAVLPLFLLVPYVVTSGLGMLQSPFFFLPLLSLPLAMLALPSDHSDATIATLPRRIVVVGFVFGILYLQSVLYITV